MRRFPFVLLAALLAFPAPAHADVPNDPYYVVQWGLKKLEAVRSWQVTRGRGAVVAVVDTGVDPLHPDLQGRLLPGKDFVDGDTNTSDTNGHGTLVAGIIAATTGNGVGVASVAPEAKILPVRVLGSDGSGTSGNVAQGIRWAASHGANVINLSLAEEGEHGSSGFQASPSLLRDPAVDQAITDASSEGVTVVVAAGNTATGGKPETAYDATQSGVVVVGATAPDDRRAAYSNYGSGLDLVAPGGGSSTDPSDHGCTRDNSIVSLWWNPKTKHSDYGGGCGTSMAVAFVSGVAALLHANGLSNEQIVNRMIATAVDLGPKGRDDQTGAGLVDAALALGAPPLPVEQRPGPKAQSVVHANEMRRVVKQSSARQVPLPAAANVDAAPAPSRREGDNRNVAIEIASALVCALGLVHWFRFAVAVRRGESGQTS